MIKNYEEIASFGKQNVEALVQSSTLAAKGVEELAKAYAAFGGQSFEKTTATMKALASAKTPAEFVELQAQLARDNAEALLAEGRRLAEIASTVFTSAFEPIQARFAAAGKLYQSAA